MRKLQALKVGGVQREEKRKKMSFVSWKAFFFLLLFFHYSFSFALPR
jgi:hypothetical protein